MKRCSQGWNQFNIRSNFSDAVEETVHRAVDDVEAGRKQLAEAAKSQAKCRRKSIILLIIAVIIAAIVIGVVVSKLKK